MRLRSRGPYILWLIIVCALGANGRANAQEKPANPITIHVDSLVANDSHAATDAALMASTLGRRLRAAFDYSSYRLLRHQDEETQCGQAVAFNLPGGRILHVAPLEVEGGMIVMEMVLFEGAHVMMRTELKMVQDGALILVGPRRPEETFITTIAVDVQGLGREELPQPESTPQLPVGIGLNPAIPPDE